MDDSMATRQSSGDSTNPDRRDSRFGDCRVSGPFLQFFGTLVAFEPGFRTVPESKSDRCVDGDGGNDGSGSIRRFGPSAPLDGFVVGDGFPGLFFGDAILQFASRPLPAGAGRGELVSDPAKGFAATVGHWGRDPVDGHRGRAANERNRGRTPAGAF